MVDLYPSSVEVVDRVVRNTTMKLVIGDGIAVIRARLHNGVSVLWNLQLLSNEAHSSTVGHKYPKGLICHNSDLACNITNVCFVCFMQWQLKIPMLALAPALALTLFEQPSPGIYLNTVSTMNIIIHVSLRFKFICNPVFDTS